MLATGGEHSMCIKLNNMGLQSVLNHSDSHCHGTARFEGIYNGYFDFMQAFRTHGSSAR